MWESSQGRTGTLTIVSFWPQQISEQIGEISSGEVWPKAFDETPTIAKITMPSRADNVPCKKSMRPGRLSSI